MDDEAVTLRDIGFEELPAILDMEQGQARDFVIPYTLRRHREEFAKPDVVYKAVCQGKRLVGFVILALDPDGRSVEFRRIVVSETGCGIGRRAVGLVRELCKRELGRRRVWLDVFESNERARHVYEKCGYSRFGAAEHDGRKLLLYERMT